MLVDIGNEGYVPFLLGFPCSIATATILKYVFFFEGEVALPQNRGFNINEFCLKQNIVGNLEKISYAFLNSLGKS